MMTVGKSSRRLYKAATALREQFGEMILSNQSLTSFNTFGTGGNAGLFAEIKTIEELSTIVQAATELGIPFFMIGGGSNILVSDNGYDGLIIKNSIMGLTLDDTGIIAGAGERLQALVDFAAENCLTGLEFATGIWGTVGGAIYGNAGAYGSETGTIVESVQLVDRQGKVRTEQASCLEFGYRTSRLKKTGEFIARAKFALNMGNRDTIQTKIDEIKALRREKLPIDEHSAGCFFKNIPDEQSSHGKLSAGKLLEEIGAKQLHYGGACVFKNHANILINDGTACSKDIRHLAEVLKQKVKEKYGIELKEEITYLGDFEKENL